jgi:hypothetical protein
MSWHYLRVEEEESLQDICSGGEQLPLLKSKIIHAEFYCNGKLMDSYLDSLSGMTFVHSMESLGEEKSMSSQEDFLVKTLVLQEKAQDSMEKGRDSGEKWQGSFAKYSQDSCSWKTHQCSLLGDLDEFLETWPQWGLMRDGECWEHQTLERSMKGNESGLWPTPTVCGNYNRKGASKTSGDGLATAVAKWPTPTAHNAKETNSPSEALRNEPTLAYRVGGKLNPTWVEWLMGWPLGWTDLKPLETDKSHCVQQQLGES